MKIRHYIYVAMALILAGCSKEESAMPESHANLIGRGVRFQTTMAEPFETRTTQRHDGRFNEGDLMTIYRQYSNDAGITFDSGKLTYRVYQYDTKYATGTDIALETDWKPKAGAIGCNNGTTFTQTAADSLTWENGKTVRFRSWSRSNMSGTANSTNKNVYYPDYCVSGWVTVSGPTLDVSMTLKHLGCRIGFIQKSGNVLYKAEICTEAADYMREDNSTDNAADAADKWAEAEAKAAAVKAVYDKMCMPSGVDINNSLLTAMTSDLYTNSANLTDIHTKTEADGIVKFNTQTAENIANSVQRPLFTSNIDGRLYMVSIPYDMSTDATRGESLTLPSFTRFRVYIFDVNDGDKAHTDDYEATYHIFSLSDIKKKNSEEALFPDGLQLLGGYSYTFTVGYQYDRLTITPADNFSWKGQDAEGGTASDARQEVGETGSYTWWKSAIRSAIPKTASESYNPAFHLSTAEEFLEFIKLVNGTAVTADAAAGNLTRVLDPYKTYSSTNPATRTDYRWYPTEYVSNGKVLNQHKADSTTHADAEAAGYIFYEHYHPANADQAAYSIEDYLRGPYSFYDEDLSRHFMVYLDNDLDLFDWKLTTIGNAAANPFRGLFDGQSHTIKNIYMDGAYMFGTCYDVSIMNVNIETTHDFKLINTSQAKNSVTGYGADFVGISIKAPCSGHPFANSVTGSSYMVGCFYEGAAGGAMIGSADNLYMYGNMVAATGLTSTTGALLGAYANSDDKFFAPQTKAVWGRFMVNYYDISLSPGVTAVGGIADKYELPQQYIRGAESHILKAKNDNLLSDDVSYDLLTSDLMKRGYYGLAPWKALNYAIYKYNSTTVGGVSPCNVHFVANTVGYDNQYPQLVSGKPNSSDDHTGYNGNYESLNVLKQNN